MPIWYWFAGGAAAGIVSIAAWRFRALSRSGAIAATGIGTLIVGCAGWWAGTLLVAFFVSASLLSLTTSAMTPTTSEQARGNRRDWVQVLANGGVPTVFAIIAALASNTDAWLVGFASAVAAATSDTWATEVGRLMGAMPRSLADWSIVPPGTSGAVSGPGTLGAAAGAALIAGLTAMGTASDWWVLGQNPTSALLVVLVAGFVGCIVDSLIGATMQARNWCPSCERYTERAVHSCGKRTIAAGGYRWLNNDLVNGVAVIFSGLVGLVAWLVIF